MWTKDRIIDRLYNYEEDREFAANFYRVFSPKNIKKRDLKAPPFNPAFENQEFYEAFDKLTMTEQYLLKNLFGKDMNLDNTWSKKAEERVMKETGLTKDVIDLKVHYALGCLINYLNGGEKNG